MPSEWRWWQFSRSFVALPLEGRKKVTHSRKLRSTYVRISRLHEDLGGILDELRAPLRIHAFVAYAPERLGLSFIDAQQARFDATLTCFEQGKRWPNPRELSALARQIEAKLDIEPPPPEPTARKALSADCTLSLASAVMERDPEIAELLTALAERRRQAESGNP